jgi:phosphoribosylanthranilate isomerase
MFRIKICGITNIDDAQAATRAGADAIGLNFFNKSRRFVEPSVARQIAASLPQNVAKVGVFVNHEASQITSIAHDVGLDYVQLHGDEPPELVLQLPAQIGIIRAHRCGADGLSRLAHYLSDCAARGRAPDATLIDADTGSEYGGTGRIADWDRIVQERGSLGVIPLILAGGLTPTNIAAAITAVRPDAVDVASGVEREPGIKDPHLITQFIAAAQQAFATT